jgi:CBS domain-containing protein
MNTGVSVRDVMTHGYVGVSESDDLQTTASLMLAEDVDCVVVLRGAEPVGLLTERELLEYISKGQHNGKTTVGTVMRGSGRTIEPSADVDAAFALMTTEDVRRLLVDDGKLQGLLTEHDLLAASTLERYQARKGGNWAELNTQNSSSGSIRPANGGEPDRAVSNQSICQECGALTRNLTEMNGQILCGDCRDI